MNRTTPCVWLTSVVAAALVSGCDRDVVPPVSDPHNIVVDGKPMTQLEFIKTYCQDKVSNKTCQLVRDATNKDVGSKPFAKGW